MRKILGFDISKMTNLNFSVCAAGVLSLIFSVRTCGVSDDILIFSECEH